MGEYGIPTDAQLKKINKLAKRTLSKDEVFVWSGKLAGDMVIPDRYVQLTKELLDVFAANAAKGVSFLLDHSWHADGLWGLGGRPKAAIPYGRSFDSSFGSATEEGETVSLNADSYMRRGIELDGIKTDDLIQSIESGTLFDTSIGFNFNKGICSVCGCDYYNSEDCPHYAGRTYEVEDDDGKKEEKLCWIKAYPPGGLWENSGVFDGAYPGAGIMSSAGDILENEHGVYQVITDLKEADPAKPVIATYSPRVGLLTMVKKANHKKPYAVKGLVEHAKASVSDREGIFAIGDKLGISRDQVINIANLVLGNEDKKGKGDETSMKINEKTLKMLEGFGISFKEGETKTEDMLSQLAEKWNEQVQRIEGISDCIFMTKEQAKEKLGKETAADDVLKLAVEGQNYYEKVVEDALAMGVRAMANDFPSDTWKETFKTMGTKAINDIAKTWESQAKNSIPANRQTDLAAGQGSEVVGGLPDEAYKVK